MTDRDTAAPVITSAANPQIKMMRSLVRRKSRQAERAFLVEGQRLVEEAARQDGAIRMLLVREDVPRTWVDRLGVEPERVRRVRADVFDAASEVEHAQGVAAICAQPDRAVAPEDIAAGDAFVLILDRLRDPGNLGTALRSAVAAGVETVLVTHGSVDPYAPKVVRAGMGAHFRLTLGHVTPAILAALQASGRAILHADAGAGVRYTDVDWRDAVALVIGGETEALSTELAPCVSQRVAIPMRGGMESLNAGVAASVLLYEVQRQGRI